MKHINKDTTTSSLCDSDSNLNKSHEYDSNEDSEFYDDDSETVHLSLPESFDDTFEFNDRPFNNVGNLDPSPRNDFPYQYQNMQYFGQNDGENGAYHPNIKKKIFKQDYSTEKLLDRLKEIEKNNSDQKIFYEDEITNLKKRWNDEQQKSYEKHICFE